jgi:hypothetical protein
MNATHFLQDVSVAAGQLLEVVSNGLEAIVNIFFVGITTYMRRFESRYNN